MTAPVKGSLTVFPDVIVQEDSEGEWGGISRQPLPLGTRSSLMSFRSTPSRENSPPP